VRAWSNLFSVVLLEYKDWHNLIVKICNGVGPIKSILSRVLFVTCWFGDQLCFLMVTLYPALAFLVRIASIHSD
jgi:hypothetical protein